MADNIMTPSGSGGIIRYDEEYPSRFMIKPEYIIIFVVIIVIGMAALKLFSK
jgi:preprotein translocase subunit Sec61beta